MFDGVVNWFKGLLGQNKKKKNDQQNQVNQPVQRSTQTTPTFLQNAQQQKQSSLITQPKVQSLTPTTAPTSAEASATINKGITQTLNPQTPKVPQINQLPQQKPVQAPQINPQSQQQKSLNIQPVQQAKPLDVQPAQPKPLDIKPAQPKQFDTPVLKTTPLQKTTTEKEQSASNFANYINPFGSHGIFGAPSVVKNLNTVNKGVDASNNWIDKHSVDSKNANNGTFELSDIPRFAAKLPGMMASGFAEAPSDLREGITGKHLNTDDNGNIKSESNLSPTQRVAAVANAGLNTLGLEYGASKTLLQSLAKNGAKIAAENAARAASKSGVKGAIKEFAKDTGKEGLEEGVQSLAQDLQQNGQFDDGTLSRAVQSAALGAAGGSIMHAAGKGVDALHGMVLKNSQGNTNVDLPLKAQQASNEAPVEYKNNESVPGGEQNATTQAAPTTRDERLPDVVQEHPQTQEETQAAINNGIITPQTASLSVDEKVQTALNSRIGVQYRQQQAINAKTNTNTSDSAGTPSVTSGDVAQSPDTPNYAQAANDVANAPINSSSNQNVDQAVSDLYSNYGKEPWFRQQFPEQVAAIESGATPMSPAIQYRTGDPNGMATRSQMQQVQLDNNRMFGTDAPNVEFVNDITTDDGQKALGATIDTPDGPSKIQLLRDQGDPRATNFHEAVHAALNDYMTQEERTQVLMSYATDQRVSAGTSQDAIEDMMANDFIQYVASQKQKGFKAPTLTQRVRAIFEQVFKRIQYVVAKQNYDGTLQPKYKQFYADLYSGEYATRDVIDKDIRDGATPEQLALQDHRDTLQQQWENTPDQQARHTIARQIAGLNQQISQIRTGSIRESVQFREDPQEAVRIVEAIKSIAKRKHGRAKLGSVTSSAANIISSISGAKLRPNATIEIESRYARHILKKHTSPVLDLKPLTDSDLADITKVINRPDNARPGNFAYGSQRVRLTKQLADKRIAIVDVIKEGNALNVISFYNASSRLSDAAIAPQDLRPKRGESKLETNIANYPRIVKGGRRFMVSGKNATGFNDAQKQGRIFEGVDSKPRFEIGDQNAKFMSKSQLDELANRNADQVYQGKLSDVLQHDELYRNYPELKNTDVYYDAGVRDYYGAEYDPETNEITLGAGLTDEQIKEGILHEIQHAIQEREGFARGASAQNPDYMRSAGEAEARATAARRNMADGERYVMPDRTNFDKYYHGSRESFDNLNTPRSTFYDSLDVPKDKLIVQQSGDSVRSMSVERNANDARASIEKAMNDIAEKATDDLPQEQLDKYSRQYDLLEKELQKLDEKQQSTASSEPVKMTKALRDEIDDVIGEERFNEAYRQAMQDETTPSWVRDYGLQRMHVDDLKHYLGNQYTNIPINLRRRTGDRNIDTMAKESGFDDVDNYLDAVTTELNRRRDAAVNDQHLKDLRKDPKYIKKAQENLKKRAEGDTYGHDTVQDYVQSKMPKFVSEAYQKRIDGKKLDSETSARLDYWLNSKADAIISRYNATEKGMAQLKHDKRVKTFEDFMNSRQDAETLADFAPEVARVEHIKSKLDILHLPGGDKVTKIGVGGPRNSKAVEFAVASTVDSNTGKPSFELTPLDGTKHVLKNGTVVDKSGKSVGSYVSIDDAGNQVAYVEGKPINISKIFGDINAWGNINKSTWDMDRLIEANAPDKATALKVQKFTTNFKDKQEAAMKTELVKKRTDFQELESNIMKHRPRGVSKKQLSEDLFTVTEHKMTYEELQQKYDQKFIDNYIKPTVTWWRKTADEMLQSTNRSLEANGFDPIPRLDNYISHIQKDPTFWEHVGIGIKELNPLGASVDSDINPGQTRNGVPDEIVGRTENTSARRKWNPFAQTRKGSLHDPDFFKSIDAYFEPMLFNKYMTPAASRARLVERTFRTFEKAREIARTKEVNDLAEFFGKFDAERMVEKKRLFRSRKYKEGRNGPFITAWQEYGNMLAGKTNKIDRVIIDSSEAAAKLMRANSKAQGIVGASTIPGSMSASIAQVLSLPQTFARDSLSSFAKGVFDMVSNDGKRADSNDPMRKSAFMRNRYTDASTKRKTTMQKYTKKASIPMELIERTTGEISWRSAYRQALKDGMSEKDAIVKADIEAKKTLAGRGVGDKPLLMNSKALGMFTQFGLEVNNMRNQFFNDMSMKQKIKFMGAAAAMNMALGALTGTSQLPDYIKAIYDSMSDYGDSEDDKKDTAWDNALQAFQRMLGETAKFVPGAGQIAGTFMDDRTKEKFFGKNSDVERFGTPAMSKVLGIGKDAISGKWGDAAGTAASLLPTGNQWKKTITGIGALQKGYTENQYGNVQNVYDNGNVGNKIKASLFGSYAIPGEADARNRGTALTDAQTKVFKAKYEQDPQSAADYFNKMMDIKVKKSDKHGTITDIGAPKAANAASVPEGGDTSSLPGSKKGSSYAKNIVLNEKNDIDRKSYKELATTSNKKDDDTYAAYIYAYKLEKGTSYDPESKSDKSTGGSDTIKKLNNVTESEKGSDVAGNVVDLFKGTGDAKDIPDWVKKRFYKESGYSDKQIEYGALSSYKAQAKLDAYYRPIAQEADHQKLLDTLWQGRTKSIYGNGSIAAQDSIITSLQKEGYLSKDEAKRLKSVKLDDSGNEVESKSTGSRSKRGGRGSKKSTSQFDKSLISDYVNGSKDASSQDMVTILKKYMGTSFSTGSVKASSPSMRSLRKKTKSSSKREKIRL